MKAANTAKALSILEVMRIAPVIPVIVIADPVQAVHLARALVAGGIRALEVTLRTPTALAVIRAIASEVPKAIVGAGTLTRPEDFADALAVGARFGVSPGLTPVLSKAARESGLPLLPGVMTPSEVIDARQAGFHELKLFPAQFAGGIGMLQVLAESFPDVFFCPGGVTINSAAAFLAQPNVACVSGTWLTQQDDIAAGDWAAITKLAKEASRLQ